MTTNRENKRGRGDRGFGDAELGLARLMRRVRKRLDEQSREEVKRIEDETK